MVVALIGPALGLAIEILEAAPIIEALLSQLVIEKGSAAAQERDDLVAMFQRAAKGTGEITAEERADLRARSDRMQVRLRALAVAHDGSAPAPQPD